MFGIGPTELIVILIILLIFFAPIWLSLYLKKKYSGKMWLGLILSFVFPAIGQLYVEGATLYIIIVIVFHGINMALVGGFVLFTMIFSAMVMFYRLKKIQTQKIRS